MNLDDLEETLGEFLPAGFSIKKNNKGEVIVYTNLKSDEDGELIDMDEDFSEEDSDFSSDEDTDSLDELDEDEDEE